MLDMLKQILVVDGAYEIFAIIIFLAILFYIVMTFSLIVIIVKE